MRRDQPEQQLVNFVLDALRRKEYLALALVAAVVLVVLLAQNGCPGKPSRPESTEGAGEPGEYLFCFWNVENLFDDRDDGRTAKGDAEYDRYFANNPEALKQKLSNLCDVILGLNGGRGPDILAVAEIESERAAELLRQALNARLSDPALHYGNLVYEHSSGGRNIAPAILTRLGVEADRTRLLERNLRILEAHLTAAGKPLVVLASHWTSRISDKTGKRRAVYADKLYGRYRQMQTANPAVDLLICGDFNDNPDDPSVLEHLHASGDLEAVRAGDGRLLFNLFAGPWQQGAASHYYGTKPYLFDQVVVSPGMLDDEGWSVDVSSAKVIPEMATRQGRPNRFGGENDKRPLSARGASDHFPVTVRLRVR
jgi:endonuclease/exonuclease/phosphatase family metal-dependent hydrolase